MAHYSRGSMREIVSCTVGLQKTFKAVLQIFDHSIQCGHRGWQKQTEHFKSGASKAEYPQSKHNSKPSKGVDACPYPYTEDRETISYFAGLVVATGASMGVKIRWGGDWDRDNELIDNKFDDLFHFEEIA